MQLRFALEFAYSTGQRGALRSSHVPHCRPSSALAPWRNASSQRDAHLLIACTGDAFYPYETVAQAKARW